MAENDSNWPVDKKKHIISELNLLVQSLQSGTSGRLEDIIDPASPDESMWNVLLGGLEEKERNWVDAPWIIGEYYFYRRVVQAVRYYADGFDPFATTKHNGLCSSLGAIEDICSVYTSHLDASVRDSDSAVTRLEIAFGIYISLWGNKKDLSLWPAGREKTGTLPWSRHYALSLVDALLMLFTTVILRLRWVRSRGARALFLHGCLCSGRAGGGAGAGGSHR